MIVHDYLVRWSWRKCKAMGKLLIVLLMTLHTRIYHGSLGGQVHGVRISLGHGTLQLVTVFHDYMQCLRQPGPWSERGRTQRTDPLDLGDRGSQPVA